GEFLGMSAANLDRGKFGNHLVMMGYEPKGTAMQAGQRWATAADVADLLQVDSDLLISGKAVNKTAADGQNFETVLSRARAQLIDVPTEFVIFIVDEALK